MWKPNTFSNFEWCGGWNNGAVGSWSTWFLDFNKQRAWNHRGGAKFGGISDKRGGWNNNVVGGKVFEN